jgi:hypothetical protein
MPLHRCGVTADLSERPILDATNVAVGLAQTTLSEGTGVAGNQAEGVDALVELGIAHAEL